MSECETRTSMRGLSLAMSGGYTRSMIEVRRSGESDPEGCFFNLQGIDVTLPGGVSVVFVQFPVSSSLNLIVTGDSRSACDLICERTAACDG